ncbi:MAG TPA: HEAT repeat domain-containing protein [Planctomycetota bacterium]|nr:HEAT repeat domain-containing protein [Planctomycetota bacterium]
MKRILLLAALALACGPAWAQDDDPDRKMPSRALFTDGLRAEGTRVPDLALALAKFRKAETRAKEEKNEDVAAGSLIHIARCNEKAIPMNLEAARRAYEEVAETYPDTKPWGVLAREKLVLRGVDVWLRDLDAALDPWRVTLDQSPQALALMEERAAVGGKILSMGKLAIPGLIWGLGHADPVIRDSAAGWLAEVIDERGIATVVSKLSDPSPSMRAGAATALRRLFLKYEEAASLDRQARSLERDIHFRTSEGSKNVQDHLALEVAALRCSAAAARRNIPANLGTPHIEEALRKIITDESAYPDERCEATSAVARIGRISGVLVDALLKGMESRDRNVRAACCRAGGAVDPLEGEDRHHIADRLMRTLSYEPAKDSGQVTPDWANDELVRQSAATALGQIGLVKSIPSLIRALDDNNVLVRGAAFLALHKITGKDIPYQKGLAYESDQPLVERRKAQAQWQEWWQANGGVAVLVDRFWSFQSTCEDSDLVDLFYPPGNLRSELSRRWISADSASDRIGAGRLQEEFRARKEVLAQDALDLGPEAFDQLLAFIGGQTDRDTGPNAATRAFVAEACAHLVRRDGIAGGADKLRKLLLQDESMPKKAGAAMALGFLGKDAVTVADRKLLESSGLGSSDPEVRRSAALALALVGNEKCAAALTRSAQDPDQNVAVAALRALVEIHPRNADTVRILGDLIADEPLPGMPSKKVHAGARAPLIRETSAVALGAIADPAALDALIRARCDDDQSVRDAARESVQQLFVLDPKGTNDHCLKVFAEDHRKSEDRRGALLCLEDRHDPSVGKSLAQRLVDSNPPRMVREPDAGIRIAICEALGTLRNRGMTFIVVDALIRSLADEDEQMEVREAAFGALTWIRGIKPAQLESAERELRFRASDPRPVRDLAVARWKAWFELEKGSLKDPVCAPKGQ